MYILYDSKSFSPRTHVLVTYCCPTNYPKKWLKKTIISCYLSNFCGSGISECLDWKVLAWGFSWRCSQMMAGARVTPELLHSHVRCLGWEEMPVPHCKVGCMLLQPSLEIPTSHTMVYLFIHSVLVSWTLVGFSVLWILHISC